MQRALVFAVQRVEETKLAPQPVPGVPPVEVRHDADLLGHVLRQKLEHDGAPQQLPTFEAVVQPMEQEADQQQGEGTKDRNCSMGVLQHPVVFTAMPLAEVLPALLETALWLAVDVLKVLDSGINDNDPKLAVLLCLRVQAQITHIAGMAAVVRASQDAVLPPLSNHGLRWLAPAPRTDVRGVGMLSPEIYPPACVLVRRQRLDAEQERRRLRQRHERPKRLVCWQHHVEAGIAVVPQRRREAEDPRIALVPRRAEAEATATPVLRAAVCRQLPLELSEVLPNFPQQRHLEEQTCHLQAKPRKDVEASQSSRSEILAEPADRLCRIGGL
mmetsp:Transcript_34745/g.95815  ORF Transcript_34745/g.95815 Transcript_34745/m.95815 type:complete len:329 (+) Transcript_34745:157-1143(+)